MKYLQAHKEIIATELLKGHHVYLAGDYVDEDGCLSDSSEVIDVGVKGLILRYIGRDYYVVKLNEEFYKEHTHIIVRCEDDEIIINKIKL